MSRMPSELNRRRFLAGVSVTALAGVSGCFKTTYPDVNHESFREKSYLESVKVKVNMAGGNVDSVAGQFKLKANHPIRRMAAYWELESGDWGFVTKKDVESSERNKELYVPSPELPLKIEFYDDSAELVERVTVPDPE